MTQRNENRIRKLERAQKPAPYPEESFAHCGYSEEEFAALIAMGRAALAGDRHAEADLQRMLTDARPTKGLCAMHKLGDG